MSCMRRDINLPDGPAYQYRLSIMSLLITLGPFISPVDSNLHVHFFASQLYLIACREARTQYDYAHELKVVGIMMNTG